MPGTLEIGWIEDSRDCWFWCKVCQASVPVPWEQALTAHDRGCPNGCTENMLMDPLTIQKFISQLPDPDLCDLSNLIEQELHIRAERMVYGGGVAYAGKRVRLSTAQIH